MDARTYWINMGISVTLVLLGGVFAGLTLGLMGQDEIYLQVIQQSGEVSEKRLLPKFCPCLNVENIGFSLLYCVCIFVLHY